MVKANVDKIVDILKLKKSASINFLSKEMNVNKNDIEKSAEYLEQDGIVKIEHKFPNTIVTLIKEPEQKKEAIPPELMQTEEVILLWVQILVMKI